MKDSPGVKGTGCGPAAWSPIADEQLQLARRILEIVREQREAIAGLPEEETLDRFMALAGERQECMDRFDRLQAVRSAATAVQPPGDGLDAEVRQVSAAIEALFREAAEIDAANRQRLEESRDLVREEIRRARQGRDALRSYGRQEPGGGGLTDGAFVDRKE